MAASGYTPILLYASGTATNVPLAANLTSSASGAELALNYADGKLYFKNSSGVVTLLAGSGGGGPAAGSNTQLQFNSSGVFGASANLTWSGTVLSTTGLTATGAILHNTTTNNQSYTTTGAGTITISSGTAGTINNMSIGATTAGAGTFSSITNTGLTSGRVVYSTTGGLETDSANLTFDGTNLTLAGGTANGVAYLNGSKVLTTGSALTFDGSANFYLGTSGSATGRSISINSNLSNTGVYLYSDTAQTILGVGADLPLIFKTNAAEQMRLTSTGLGIGTSSITNKLTVNGSIGASGSTGAFSLYRRDTNAYAGGFYSASGGILVDIPGVGTAVTIDSSGNLLVGTTSYAGSGLSLSSPNGSGSYSVIAAGGTGFHWRFGNVTNGIVGSITTTTSTTAYNTSSDYRLKENIQDADSASALIDSLQVRQFDWKSDNSHQRYGFVAQELVTVAPEAVHQPADPDDMMAVDYSKLVPMLVKEIQSLRKRLTALESKEIS